VSIDATVVLACHSMRRWESLCSALTSVLTQTREPAGVVVGVDHHPQLASAVRERFPSVQVVLNDSGKRGASATRNAAASLVRSELIAFLDDDETADERWLDHLLAPFIDSSVVGTGGRYLPRWDAGRPRWFPDEFGWVIGAHHDGMPVSTTVVRNVWSGNMAVRTRVFRRIGGFRTDFGKVGSASRPEDTDLCIRAARASGGHWLYVPAAVIHHQVDASRSTLRFFAHRCVAEGRGKVEMARLLGDAATLDHERAYMRRTVPLGMLRHVARGRISRASVMALGVVCASWGVASAAGHRRVPPQRLEPVARPGV